MNRIIGVVLIVFGGLIALNTLGLTDFGIGDLWPLVLLLPGIGFHVAYFSAPHPSRAGLLVPGGVLVTYGLLFFYNQIAGGIGGLWPVFLLGPALGLFELYWFGYRQPALLIPVAVLTFLGVMFLGVNLLTSAFGGVFGVLLVLLGVYLIFGKGKKRDEIQL